MTPNIKRVENNFDMALPREDRERRDQTVTTGRLLSLFIASLSSKLFVQTIVIFSTMVLLNASCLGKQDSKPEQASDNSASTQTETSVLTNSAVSQKELGREKAIARINRLTAESLLEFEKNPQSSLRLAIEAYEVFEQSEVGFDQTVLFSWLFRLSQRLGGVPLRHAEPISTFAIAPNGSYILTASSGKLYSWKVKKDRTAISKGKMIHDFGISEKTGRRSYISEIEFNPANSEQVMVQTASHRETTLLGISNSGDATPIATWALDDNRNGWRFQPIQS